MGWVDQVRSAGNLYIGGLYALYQTDLIRAANITHVLSVINYDPLLQEKFAHLKHFHVRAEDDPNENLLQHFDSANEYIDSGLKSGGGVFVHCAMGKSRSAAFVVAFLMWRDGVSWEKGLERLCEGRPVCEPNVGFREQLGVYERILGARDEGEKERIYRGWLENRFVGTTWEWDARLQQQKEVKASL